MAGENRVTNGNDSNEGSGNRNGGGDTSLRNFVSQEFHSQRQSSNLGVDEISDARATEFLQRALSESQRMAAETLQSEARRRQLYAELGKERFEEWTKEHIKEANDARIAAEEERTVER